MIILTILTASATLVLALIQPELGGHLISILPAPVPNRTTTVTRSFARSIDPRANESDVPSCLNRYGPICADCNTLWTCVGGASPAVVQNCENSHPGKPLCERNACTATVDATSGCASPLQCTGSGYYPNPVNCSQYYFCANAGGDSLVYECPIGFVYNAWTTRCARATYQTCLQVDCNKNANQYVSYSPTNSTLYAFCLRRLGVLTPIMLNCPSVYHRFNDTEQRCRFECQADGRFPDVEDEGAYYDCLWINEVNDYIVRHERCLRGHVFQYWSQSCSSTAVVTPVY